MKVDGWLEKAQFENIASGSPTPTPTGRIYTDTTVPTVAVPRFYNGTAWLPFLLGQSSALVAQSSGKAVTVNWANGLFQQVILNNHATISFSNPQSGQIHTLIVTQAATESASVTPWMFKFNMPDQLTRRTGYQPNGVLQSFESQLFSWFYTSSGLKPAYNTVPPVYSNPATLPTTLLTGIDLFPGSLGSDTQLNRVGTVFGGRTSSPFGQSLRYYDGGAKFYWQKTDISTPTAAAAQLNNVAYHPDGHTLFGTSGTTPFLQAWGVDIYGVPNQNAYANPGTVPTGAAQCVAVSPSGAHVGVGHTTTPFVSVYPVNSGAFGTKLTNPVSLPVAQVNALAWAPTGDFLVCAGQTTPFIEAYPFDPFTGFGTKVTAPGVTPAGGPPGALGKGVAWNPSGTFVAMGMNSSPFLTVIAFNRATGLWGTSTTPSVSGPAATINCVAWSPCGNYLAAGNSAGLFIFDMSAGAGIPASAPLTFDSGGPGVQVNDIVWHPSGELLFLALNASPFIMTYPAPRKLKSYLKLID